MSAPRRVARWCLGQSCEVYGWLGFMLLAGLSGGIGAAGILAVLWLVREAVRIGLTWYALWAIPAVVLALLAIWVLSLVVRLRGAPWRSILLLLVLESVYLWRQF